jgi:hypothetical protein
MTLPEAMGSGATGPLVFLTANRFNLAGSLKPLNA